MDDEWELIWQVEDGYAGGSRPQSTSVSLSDLDGMDGDEIREALEDLIGEEFNQRISWFSSNLDETVTAIQEAKRKE